MSGIGMTLKNMKEGYMNAIRTTVFRKSIVAMLLMVICLVMAGCGSSGGMNDADDDDDDGSTPQPTYNFKGTVFNSSGTTFSGLSVQIFSTPTTVTTDSSGKFSANVTNDKHTVLVERSGYLSGIEIIDLSSGGSLDIPMLLYDASATSVTVLASAGTATPISSNVVNDLQAKLAIPPQSSSFGVLDTTRASANILLENINLNKPCPIPLPDSDNTAVADLLNGEQQTPRALISIQPAMLSFSTPATLTLPIPTGFTIGKVLRFDVESHQWVATGALDGANLSITKGGYYGVFYETAKNGAVRGTVSEGTIIVIGDEVVTVGADKSFYIAEVAVPPTGDATLMAIGPKDATTGLRTVTQTSVTIEAGKLTTVDLSQQTTVAPKSLSLSAGIGTVKSDNSDSVIISATVLDSNNAPIASIPVSFKVDGGMITSAVELADDETFDPSQILTDKNGVAQVKFSSGTADRSNRTVTLTASVTGLAPKTMPIQIIGSTLALENDKNTVDVEGTSVATITVTARDAAQTAVYDTPIVVSVTPEGALSWIPSNTNYRTNVSGKLTLQVSGKKAGEATLKLEGLGVSVTQAYTVTSQTAQFGIISPTEDPASLSTNQELTVVVRAPTQSYIRFSTTFGSWENGSKVLDVPVVSNTASARLKSSEAGLATVQVFDMNDQAVNDSMQVAISAPSSEASQISLQTGTSVVKPSSGDTKNTVTLKATVKNASDQVVGGAPVLFSISRTTGGGEYVSPVIVYTDSNGVATSIFYAGSLSSDGNGVKITASIIGKPQVQDTRSIIIGDTPGSVVIGRATVVTANDEKTAYILSLSTLVSDSNGNPVSGAKVTLGAWPTRYATGYWTSDEPCETVVTGTYPNEDVNRNLIMDPGEDKHSVGLRGYGELTPPNSAAGSIEPSVGTTNANGIATFTLTYLKASAAWTEAEITATTYTFGSETQSTLTFWLPWLKGEECTLPNAPYDSPQGTVQKGQILLSAEKNVLLANGQANTTLTATLVDPNGNIVAEGYMVNFAITQGGGGFPTLKNAVVSTDTLGLATLTYTAPTGISSGEKVTITATSSGFEDTSVELTLGIGTVELQATSITTVTANGSDKVGLKVLLTGVDGQLISTTERVNFTLTGAAGGTLPATEFAKGDGTVEVDYIAPAGLPTGKVTDTVTITASMASGAVSNPVTITLLKEKIASITLTPTDTSITADGKSSTTIKAEIKNNQNSPAAKGTPVVFTTDRGKFNEDDGDGVAKTYTVNLPDVTGIVYVTLISEASATAVTANVTCEAGGISQKTTVTFTVPAVSEPPTTIEVKDDYPDPTTINVKGTWENKSSEIRFVVKDKAGKVVDDGYTILFEIINGPNAGEWLSATSATTSAGEVTVVLNSGIRLGTVVMRARYSGNSQVFATAQVTIVGGLPVGESFDIWPIAVGTGSTYSNVQIPIASDASDIYGNTVADGTRIFFKTYNTGGFVDPASSPTSGGLADDPNDSATVKVGTVFNFPNYGSGISSAGAVVTAETEGGPSTRISTLSVIPVTEFDQIVFAGTNGGGIYKSLDSGATWQNVSRSPEIMGQNWIDTYVNDITFDPDDPNRIYAATGLKGHGGLYRSVDGGVTWNDRSFDGLGPLDDEYEDSDGTGTEDEIPSYPDLGRWSYPVLTVVCDDNGSDYVWVGLEQAGVYYSDDGGEDFTVGAGIGSRTVNKIVKAAGSSASAVLYAATSNGVYRSATGGQSWEKPSSSFNGYVTTIAVHPASTGGSNDVVYVGTQDTGFWVSTDSGKNWTQHISGIDTKEKTIRDILVDAGHNRLYIATYYFGALDAHAVGGVYVHELMSNGAVEIGGWEKANTGLPVFDKGVDNTLLAPYVFAAVPDRLGDFFNPRALFVGGEGISLSKASSGLESGGLTWQSSKTGITNTIMVRLPISKTAMLSRLVEAGE